MHDIGAMSNDYSNFVATIIYTKVQKMFIIKPRLKEMSSDIYLIAVVIRLNLAYISPILITDTLHKMPYTLCKT